MPLTKSFCATIVIPAKNEEQTIEDILDKILLNFSADRIIIIADGIVEPTSEIARRKNVKVVQGNGKGKGAAIKAAIDNTASDILIFIDADGSHKPEDIQKLIQPIVDGQADMVIASRIKGGSEEFSGNIKNVIHYIGNIVSSFIVNLIWAQGKKIITDCNNGFRAIKTNVAKQLKLEEDDFAIEQEMTIKCIKMGYRICEVPSYEFKRQYGKSHVNSMRMLPKHISCFIKNIF